MAFDRSVSTRPAPTGAPDWLTVVAAAKWLGIGRRSIYSAIRRGHLRSITVNERGDLRILRQWLTEWTHAADPTPTANPANAKRRPRTRK